MNKLDKIFDDFYFPKKWNYIFYWLFLGIIFFVFSEILLYVFKESKYLTLRLSAITLIVLLSITGNFIRKNFNTVLISLDEIMEFPAKDFDKWRKEIDELIFTIKTPISKVIVTVLPIFAISVMFNYGLPFQNNLLNAIAIISILPLIVIGSFGTYLLAYLLYVLYKIVRYPTNVPFYLIKHPSVIQLSSFFAQASIYILGCYTWFVITMWVSPYQLDGIILISVVIIGFYPLSMFLWSFSQTHTLLKNIKQKHIVTINKQIQIAIENLQKEPSKEKAELLKELMGIQKSVESLNDYPLALGEVSTFFVTLGIPILNAVLSFTNIVKP